MAANLISVSNREEEKVVTITFDYKMLEKLQNGRWQEFSSYLKDTFKIVKLSDGSVKKIVMSGETLNFFDECLNLLHTKLEDEEVIQVITEVFRSLRNCISNTESQTYVVEQTDILTICSSIFSKIMEIDPNILCLKILLQFLINFISTNRIAAEKVHNIFFEQVKKCLQNRICVYESSALIYNVLLKVHVPDRDLINIIFDNYNSDTYNNEYLSFFLEHSISKDYFWDEYEHFTIQNKIVVLEILRNMQINMQEHNFPLTGLEILVDIFLNSLELVFQLGEGKEDDMSIYEVSLILEIISSASSEQYYLLMLQSNKDLLIKSGVLLINIHKLGKLSNNCFAPVQKLSEFSDKTELKNHPAFGFKADLIRLIGNLCWKNLGMQNLVRTCELIPVILDCCNMDAKNPFIIQWAILALRNLCDKNLENQQFIASLNQTGVVNSAILEETGITLESDGENHLKIVSLDSLRKNCE